MNDLVQKVALTLGTAQAKHVEARGGGVLSSNSQLVAEARAAIAAVLDDLENPDEHMLEAFWRRFDKGPNPESFNTLLGDALGAAFRAKRNELALDAPAEPGRVK